MLARDQAVAPAGGFELGLYEHRPGIGFVEGHGLPCSRSAKGLGRITPESNWHHYTPV